VTVTSRLVRLTVAVVFVGNVADLMLTRLILRVGGIEANPLLVDVIETPVGILLKVFFVGAVCVLVGTRFRTMSLYLPLYAVAVLYVGVVFHNAGQLALYLT